MVERGLVLGASGETVKVRVERSDACEGCPGCLLSDTGDYMVAEAENPLGASPGDRVRLETQGVPPAKAAALLFLFPLAALFIGYAVGSTLSNAAGAPSAAEGFGIAMAVLFFGACYGILYLVRRRRGGARAERSVIVEILDRNQQQQV